MAVPPKAEAVDYFWGGATNTDWGTSTNWLTAAGAPGAVPNNSITTSDTVTFNYTGGTIPNQITSIGTPAAGTTRYISAITFNSATAINLGGPAGVSLALVGANGITLTPTSAAHTISAPVQIARLSGSQTWTNNSANPLTLTSLLTSSSGNLNFQTTAGGTGGFRLNGGVRILNSPTWINTNAAGAVSSTGDLSLNDGTSLTLDGAGDFTFAGKIIAPPTVTPVSGATTSATLTINGTGTRTFGGLTLTANTDTNTRTFVIAMGAGANATINGVIANSSAGTNDPLMKVGPGTLNLPGTTSFTGALTVNEGILTLGTPPPPETPAVPTNTVATVNSGLVFATATGTTAAPAGSTSTLTLNTDRYFGSGTINYLAGAGNQAGTATINGQGKMLLTNNANISVSNGASADDLVIAVAMLNDPTGTTRAVTKNGSGTLVLSGANSFTGNLTINDGVVKVRTANANSGALVFQPTGNAVGMVLENDINYYLGGTLQVNAGGAGTLGVTLSGGPGGGGRIALTQTAAANRTFRIYDSANAAVTQEMVISVPIVNGGAVGNLYKEGNGTLTLTGENTYSGTTTFYRGKLEIDYVNSTVGRLSDTSDIEPRGGDLVLLGNGSGAVNEVVGRLSPGSSLLSGGSLTGTSVPTGGASTIFLDSRNNQQISLTFTGFSRNPGGGIVSLSVDDPNYAQFRTTAANDAAGLLTTSALIDGRWITNDGTGKIVAATGVLQNNVSQWQSNQHIEVTGPVSGQMLVDRVAALTFNNTTATTLTLNDPANRNQTLTLTNAGILVAPTATANVTINGGMLMTELPYITAAGADILLINNSNTQDQILKITSNLGHSDTPLGNAELITIAGAGRGIVELAGKSSSLPTYNSSTIIRGQVNVLGGGRLRVSGGDAISDYLPVNLGQAGNAGGEFDLNGNKETIGGLLSVNTDQGVNSGIINLGAGGELTVNQVGASSSSLQTASYSGSIIGSGKFIKQGASTLALINTTGGLSYSGDLSILGGLLALTGTGTGLTNVSNVYITGGEIQGEQNTGNSTRNKFSDNATFHLNGTTGNGLRITSNTSGAFEDALAVNLVAGSNVITVDANNTTSQLTLNFTKPTNGLTRNNAATLLVRGEVLGSGAASKVTFVSGVNGLVGLNGAAGTSTISILPWAIGATDPAGVGDSFVTYLAPNGFRPLAAAEYAAMPTTATTNDNNVSMNASVTNGNSVTLNSLRLDASAGSVNLVGNPGNSGQLLTIKSGALLMSAGATTNSSTIDFRRLTAGTAGSPNELVVHVTSSNANAAAATLTIASIVSDNGAGGATTITKSGAGTLVLNNAANSFSGGLNINQGVVSFAGAGALGAGGSTIRLSGGTLKWQGTEDISASHPIELLGPDSYYTPTGTGAFGNALARGNTFDVGNNSVTLGNTVGTANSTGGLVKIGTGTLNLTAAPTYKGSTVVLDGNMNFNGGISANSTSGLFLMPENGVTMGTLDVNGTTTPFLLPLPTTINSTVSGALNVQQLIVGGMFANSFLASGSNQNFAAAGTALLTATGSINIGNGSGDSYVLLAYRDEGAAAGVGLPGGVTNPSVPGMPGYTLASNPLLTGTLDLVNATSVNINVSRIFLGQNKGSGSSRVDGNLRLSNAGTNNITAGHFLIGNSPGANATGEGGIFSLVELGGNGRANNLNVDTLVVGGLNANGQVVLGSGGSLVLRDRAGTGGANVFIGDNDDITNTVQANDVTKMALDAGTVDMKINLLVIGRHGGNSGTGTISGGGGAGALSWDNGVIEASQVRLAQISTRGLSQNPELTRASISMGSGESGSSATFRFGDMSQGVSHLASPQKQVTVAFNWNAGTVSNIPGRDATNQNVMLLMNTSLPHYLSVDPGRTMTFGSTAGFDGSGEVNKIGSGTLVLFGPSPLGGTFIIDEGRVIVRNTTGSATGTQGVIVNSGAELLGTGYVGGQSIVQPGGRLTVGIDATITQLGMLDLYLEPDSILQLDIRTGGSSPTADRLALDGVLDLNQDDDLSTRPKLQITDLGFSLLQPGTPLTLISYGDGLNFGAFEVNGKVMLDYQAGVSKIEDALFIGANGFWLDYDYNSGTSITLIAVPEPGALASLIGGMGVLLGLQRFRRWGAGR